MALSLDEQHAAHDLQQASASEFGTLQHGSESRI